MKNAVFHGAEMNKEDDMAWPQEMVLNHARVDLECASRQLAWCQADSQCPPDVVEYREMRVLVAQAAVDKLEEKEV